MLIKKQQGTALLMALIIMSGLVIGGVTLGTVVINELRQSRQLDLAIVAYYGAESGAERLLYDWRDTKSQTFFSDPCNENVASQLGWTCSFNMGSITQLVFSLKNFEVQELPLYIPNQLNVPAGINSSIISWSDADTTNLIEPWLEITLVEWPAGNSVDFANSRQIIKKAFKCSANPIGSEVCENINLSDFSVNNSYVMRLRALQDDVKDISVQLFDNSATPALVDFSNYMKVADFTGEYKSIKQGVRVRFPLVEPSSSLFDSVLFSEESLLKRTFN